MPIPTHSKVLVGSEEKKSLLHICKISCNYFKDMNINDAQGSKNFQMNKKFVSKIRIQHRPDKQDS